MMLKISLLAVTAYVLASMRLSAFILKSGRARSKSLFRLLGALAIGLHAVVLYDATFVEQGLNLGVTNAASLVTWSVAALVLIVSLFHPVDNLSLIAFPLSALTLLLSQLYPQPHFIAEQESFGMQLHIVLSVLAFSLLAIAAVQALFLAFADRRLRHRNPVGVMHILPPLHTMEVLLFQLIQAGFFLLSLSLLSGFMFLEDIFAQHLVHKTVLSILAWLVFGVLLWGRYRFGWRGQRAMRWTLGGMASLLLAYFGSKAVLELILHRV